VDDPKIAWDSGEAYERYVGRWSRLVAQRFLDWLQVPPGSSWLDVGCGTGELTKAIVETQSPSRVVGVDQSEAFIAAARAGVRNEYVEFDVGDAMDLSYDEEEFNAAVTGLVLNFLPDPAITIHSMWYFIDCLDGVLGAYVWDYAGKMQMTRYFWDAAVALDPMAREFDQRYPLCQPEALEKLFVDARLEKVAVKPIDVLTVFRDFDDYWTPFLGGQGAAPGYVASLNEGMRNALREKLRAKLPAEPDGSIHLFARAWAVKGTT
jgi:SAM-dependent methyltransferase